MLSKLEQFMFSLNRITELNKEFNDGIKKKHPTTKVSLDFTIDKTDKIDKLDKTNNKEDTLFIPRQTDGLFWCFYIAFYNLDKFRFLSNYFIEENDLKIKTVEYARTCKPQLKAFKITLCKFESELALEKKININMFQSLCVLYKVNIILVRNRCFLDLCYYPEKQTFVVEEHKKATGNVQYGIYSEPASEIYINNIRNTLWKQEGINKPLKAISSYKLGDLQDICNRLQIEIMKDTKKKNKQELYSNIMEMLG